MKRLIGWFVDNPIAANLFMGVVIVGGVITVPAIDKEFFPAREVNTIKVSMAYPGAGPAEVEQQFCMRVEEAVDGIDGIETVRSYALEGAGEVVIVLEVGQETSQVLNEIKSRIDAITTFPAAAERLQVSEQPHGSTVLRLAIAGPVSERELKELALAVRDELLALEAVREIDVQRARDYEVAVEVSEPALRRYGLSFADVARAVDRGSANLPAGKLRAPDGDVQLQTRGQADGKRDFAELALISAADGAKVRVGDVAKVTDGFEELDFTSRFDGLPALQLDVRLTATDPDIIATSDAVKRYADALRARLPEGMVVAIWSDMSEPFRGRLKTLFNSGLTGLALVFALLLLFLRPMLAFWVSVGIAVSFLGAIWWLPATNTTFNVISLFAFILILGILVDDAIVVGESVYTHQTGRHGPMSRRAASVEGTAAVMKPVFFGVVTTVIIFGGFYFMGDEPEPKQFSKVVLLALTFSLLESLFILPSHLAHMREERDRWRWQKSLSALRRRCSDGMRRFIERCYLPALDVCLRHSGKTLVSFLLVFLIPLSYFWAGWIRVHFFPDIPGNFIMTTVTMPSGTPFEALDEIRARIERSAERLKQDADIGDFIGHISSSAYADDVRVIVELLDGERRPIGNEDIRRRLQGYIGELPGAKDYEVLAKLFSRGKPVALEVRSASMEELAAGAGELARRLGEFAGVFNVRSTLEDPRLEIALALRPEAEALGVTLEGLASQVRQGYHGVEAERVPRLREDVKVMVRYPRSGRSSAQDLRGMRIRAPGGAEAPFEEVAEISYRPGWRVVERADRKRVATVTAELQPTASADAVLAAVFADVAPALAARWPGLELRREGESEVQEEFQQSMASLFATAVIVIYGLMAVVLRSWWQPTLIVCAMPFGFVGAVLGHVLMGREMSMFSLMGLYACAGVVVNDNLVLVDRVNILRAQGAPLREALARGAKDRFRPIVLTSVTTFAGLTPIMLQRSVQAQFLIPMALSLAFGVLFATFVTLLFVPALYEFGERLRARLARRGASGAGAPAPTGKPELLAEEGPAAPS